MAAPQQLMEIGTLYMAPMTRYSLAKHEEFDSGIYNPGIGSPIRFTVRSLCPDGAITLDSVNRYMRNRVIYQATHPTKEGHYNHVFIEFYLDATGNHHTNTQCKMTKLPDSFRA